VILSNKDRPHVTLAMDRVDLAVGRVVFSRSRS